jgi:hypothetical protein
MFQTHPNIINWTLDGEASQGKPSGNFQFRNAQQ